MKVSVWDTYVKRKDGKIMHFDILVNENLKNEQVIFEYGKQYLKSKAVITDSITQRECKFCHLEQATIEIEIAINSKGFSIIEIENCS